MKKTFYVKKSKLYSEADYTAILLNKKYMGFSFEYNELDKIEIKSGALCMFDAYSSTNNVRPFLKKFPCSKCVPYAMSVSTSQGNRIAYAGLKFSDEAAVEWVLALTEEKDVLKLLSDVESVSAIIHSGIVCYGDYIVMREYDSLVKNTSNFHPMDSVISLDGNTIANFEVNSENKFCVFSSGWGEGNYSSFIGLSKNKEVVGFITDFAMFDKPKSVVENSEVIPYEFEITIDEMYRNNSALSDSENHIAKWSMVIDNASQVDGMTLFNAYSRRGYAYHSLQQYKNALNDYLKAIELGHKLETTTNSFKFHAWALYDNAGIINRELGNTIDAIRLFEQAKLNGDSFYAGAYTNLIDIYMQIKNLDSALEVASEMIADRPLDPNAYNKRAEVYVALEDYVNAIQDYNTLINKFKWTESIIDKSFCLSALNKFDEALECLESYLLENKANELYYYNKGLLQFKKKEFSAAYGNLIMAYNFNCDYIPTLHLLIEIGDLTFNYKEIVKWSSKYIELRAGNEFGYNIRADAYINLKQYDLAIIDYEYIVNHICQDNSYYLQLVYSYSLKKDMSKASKYAKILKNKHEVPYNMNALGIMYSVKKKFIKAEKNLLFSYEANNLEPYFIERLIEFYIKFKHFNKALDYIDKLVEVEPTSLNAYLFKIDIFKQEKNEDMVKKTANEYIEKFLSVNDRIIKAQIYNTLI